MHGGLEACFSLRGLIENVIEKNNQLNDVFLSVRKGVQIWGLVSRLYLPSLSDSRSSFHVIIHVADNVICSHSLISLSLIISSSHLNFIMPRTSDTVLVSVSLKAFWRGLGSEAVISTPSGFTARKRLESDPSRRDRVPGSKCCACASREGQLLL